MYNTYYASVIILFVKLQLGIVNYTEPEYLFLIKMFNSAF